MGSKARPRLTARALKARLVSSFRMSDFVVRMSPNDNLSHQLKILTERFLLSQHRRKPLTFNS